MTESKVDYDWWLKNMATDLERVQDRVEINHDYISWRCDQYYRDAQAWRWRSDFW